MEFSKADFLDMTPCLNSRLRFKAVRMQAASSVCHWTSTPLTRIAQEIRCQARVPAGSDPHLWGKLLALGALLYKALAHCATPKQINHLGHVSNNESDYALEATALRLTK